MIKAQIVQDRMQARKEKDASKQNILTVLLGEIETHEKRSGEALSDGQITGIVKKLIESCESTNEQDQANILVKYVPKQFTGLELEALIQSHIVHAQDLSMGSVMKWLKENYGGQYDGKEASQLVKKLL